MIEKKQREAWKLMQWKLEESKKEPPEEKEKRRKEVCTECGYWDKSSKCCIYILYEKRQRPCPGSQCVEKGVFRKEEMRLDEYSDEWE